MKAKKTSISNLNNIERSSWDVSAGISLEERRLYTHVADGERYEFLCAPKPESGRLIVFFSGDARRSQFKPPVFQRWSWASLFPATCLYFSDPALYHHDNLGLAWYAGHKKGDYLHQIWEIVESVLPALGLSNQDVYSYGSSGGGFAALRSARYFHGLTVVAINPQTDLWNYPTKWTSRLARGAYGVEALRYIEPSEQYKFTALDSAVLNGARQIFLAQNDQDVDHYKNHFSPFVRFARTGPHAEKLTTNIFSNDSGHAGAENKETFEEILRFIEGPEPMSV